MKNLKRIEKWAGILLSAGIEEKNIEKVSEFCENFLEIENAHKNSIKSYDHTLQNDISSILPLNLQIISKISDLSKVIFVRAPMFDYKIRINGKNKKKTFQIGTMQTAKITDFFKVNTERIKETFNPFYIKTVLSDSENTLAELISGVFNKKIEEGLTIFMYLPVSSIQLITMNAADSRLLAESRFAEFKIEE